MLFHEALSKPPQDRAAYLDQACGPDLELRRSLERLLASHAADASFMRLSDRDATLDTPIAERPGTVIGPYKLLQQIGEGGFGIVFVAEQERPLRRKVAFKIIKPGMDTRQVIARFEAERQALALMDHPNIAQVLDAGETASGRPYFVMELVKGIPSPPTVTRASCRCASAWNCSATCARPCSTPITRGSCIATLNRRTYW